MKYECEMVEGQHLEIENEGDQTFVSFSNRGLGQQQSQGHGFTGRWSKDPTAFRVGKDFVIRLETSESSRFLKIQGNQTTLLDYKPVLETAEKVELKESLKASGWKAMEPMKPMRPVFVRNFLS